MTTAHVFVSCAAVLTQNQRTAHRRVTTELTALGFEVIRVVRSDYVPVPWGQLREAMARANGALVLGFQQMSVQVGSWRPDTEETRSAAGWYSTPWNQIEAGLAIMAGLPVLLAADSDVSDGVFSNDVWGGDVYGLRTDGMDQPLDFSHQTVQDWIHAVRKRASEELRLSSADSA